MAQVRLLNRKAVETIMNKRGRLDETLVGKKVRFTIVGNGTVIDVKNKAGDLVQSAVEPGTVFQVRIFNLQANSSIAARRTDNQKLAAAGLAAERLGNAEEAHKHYNDFLNALQVSFNVPTTSRIVDQLGDQVDIEARVIMITTENGSLLTIDHTTIRVIEPETMASTVFSFEVFEPKVEDDGVKVAGEEAGALLTA